MGKLSVVYGTPTSVKKYCSSATGMWRPVACVLEVTDRDGAADSPIFWVAITVHKIIQPSTLLHAAWSV
jgi:hypothetical protein